MKNIILLILFTITLYSYEVTVSITPQKYFVEQIAKNKVNVNVMVKPGFSPAIYSPKTSQMRDLSKSKIYFSIDVPFEHSWLEKFKNSNKNMIIVDTSKNIKKLTMLEHKHHEDEHEEEGHEEEQEEIHENSLDPHIWLDPNLVKIQAKNILDALVLIDQKNKNFYFKNYELFITKLDNLNKTIKNILKDEKDSSFMVFHPTFNYFAKAYNLKQITVEKEGKEPKVKELIELIKDAKKHNIKVVFVSPQFSQNSAKRIAKSINANVISIDSLSYDYESNLIHIAKEIRKSNK